MKPSPAEDRSRDIDSSWKAPPAAVESAAPGIAAPELVSWLALADNSVFRRAEKVVIAYFVFVAIMLSGRSEPPTRRLLAWCVPLLIWTAVLAESRFSRGWTRVTRDWASLGLILVAYRQLDWLAGSASFTAWQRTWIGWDRFLLHNIGLQAAIERFGSSIPSTLELAYLSLYAIPALCMGALYWNGSRDRIDRFLTTLFLGTLTAYALLPHFPSIAPRIAFPNQDLPRYSGIWRSVNLWLLNRCDIACSVFPSGHVAVAFSSAFGVVRAIPQRRAFCAAITLAAVAVYAATIYGRYHYAADGLASIFVAVMAWMLCEVMDRNA